MSNIIKMSEFKNHYKIIYDYIAGNKSLVNIMNNNMMIKVENEYILPHSTVARVTFGKYKSTIITHALPVSKFKTKLFVKAYRSYWSYDLTKNINIFFPFLFLINLIGDEITKYTMFNTIKQDKMIIDNIDKLNYQSMHGKFSIVFDLFSNHYKKNYNKYYEKNNNEI